MRRILVRTENGKIFKVSRTRADRMIRCGSAIETAPNELKLVHREQQNAFRLDYADIEASALRKRLGERFGTDHDFATLGEAADFVRAMSPAQHAQRPHISGKRGHKYRSKQVSA